MKNAVMMIVTGLIGALVLAVVMTIGGSMNRNVELQANLSNAMEHTVQEAIEWETQREEEKMLAECAAYMAVALDADMDVMLEVYQVDATKGMLSLGITGNYLHPNGMDGSVQWKRTVIWEQEGEAKNMGSYEVCFYECKEEMMRGENCYKRYVVTDGAFIHAPKIPQNSDSVFDGWKDNEDYMADFSQPVSENRYYYACWNE